MNQDMMINKLAHITGKSRKEVIAALKQMSSMPDVKKMLKYVRKG
jgi:DNA-binding transcriptional regulator GbsR (MarR family)